MPRLGRFSVAFFHPIVNKKNDVFIIKRSILDLRKNINCQATKTFFIAKTFFTSSFLPDGNQSFLLLVAKAFTFEVEPTGK